MAVSTNSNDPRRVYLDQAATSWPKLPQAIAAAVKFMEDCGAATGRGAYRSAHIAQQQLSLARINVARAINASGADTVAFCSSGTHALNAAIQGLIGPGQHVITTSAEHNSVLRPLASLVNTRQVRLDIAECEADGYVSPEAIERLVRPDTAAIIIGHASNVTGVVQPIKDIAAIAKRNNSITIVDASQTLGYIPIDMQAQGIDVLAAAAHKGLRAIAGSAILAVQPAWQAQVRAFMFGGTGSQSESIDVELNWPACVEVGNLNLPAIASMAAAAQNIDTTKPWTNALEMLVAGLSRIPKVTIAGHSSANGAGDSERIPVVSITVDDWDLHDLASVLDSEFGIETRVGMHCSALIHRFIGTDYRGGTLRFSLGHATTMEEVRYTLMALATVLGNPAV